MASMSAPPSADFASASIAEPTELPPSPEPKGSVFHAARHYFPDTLRYLYLMRFSLMLWASMIGLVWADAYTGNASITRGILTPFSPWQWFFTGLMVVLPGWFALLAARIVCAYGQDRFGVTPPPWFAIVDRMEWYSFWPAQAPGALLLWRIGYNVVHEGESRYGWLTVLPCLLAGAFAACVFWYVISILYYWIWNPNSAVPFRAFLVPHWKRIPLDKIRDIDCGSSLHIFSHVVNSLAGLGPGYKTEFAVPSGDPAKPNDPAQPHRIGTAPGHIVALIALLCALFLYLLLMPISAPVPLPRLSLAGRVLSSFLAIYIVLEFILPALSGIREEQKIQRAEAGVEARAAARVGTRSRASSGPSSSAPASGKAPSRHTSSRTRLLPLLASVLMLLTVSVGILSPQAPRAVPVIAYVITLLVVLFWTLAGVAFYADHFRVPVLTLAVAIILLLNRHPADHVFPVQAINPSLAREPLRSPADFVQRIAFHGNTQANEPVVILTATGGGIHAAAWTATSLRALDQAFRAQGLDLHDHILLMSSVSGGSVATAAFLREYFAENAFNSASYDRVEATASCSSLQAVAWGLVYPDTLRLFFPFVFNAHHSHPWFPSLDRFDRGWALGKAIDRNLRDPSCIPDRATREAAGPSLTELTLDKLARLDPNSLPCLGHADACVHFPAFTLNSTVVETGDRFLLSNYSVFAAKEGASELLPAASFLGVYGRETILPLPNPAPIPSRGGYADLSILTAARLSATFTFVSPAARLPYEDAQGVLQNAFHFVDGGYYDNDGTNSVLEFLKAASQPSTLTQTTFSPTRPLRVLLIEIRNADDLNSNDSPDSYAHQSGLVWDAIRSEWVLPSTVRQERFGPIAQLMAPPEAATNAGFGSTTARNRRELDTLQRAFCGSLELKHIVIDYQQEVRHAVGSGSIVEGESELNQPLSWHLTSRQRDWISGPNLFNGQTDYALDRKKPISDRDQLAEAAQWFKTTEGQSQAPLKPTRACAASSSSGAPLPVAPSQADHPAPPPSPTSAVRQ